MARPVRIDDAALGAWTAAHTGWERVSVPAQREGGAEAIAKTYRFDDFSSALAFTVRVGLAAEKHDHHPDIELGWGKARVLWTTHDAGGVTELDLKLGAITDSFWEG